MAYLYLCVVTVSFVQRWVIEHTVLQVTLYITGKWDTHRYNRWTRVEDKDVLDIFLLLFIKKLGQHLFSVTHAIYISGGLIFFFLCVCVCVCACVYVYVCVWKRAGECEVLLHELRPAKLIIYFFFYHLQWSQTKLIFMRFPNICFTSITALRYIFQCMKDIFLKCFLIVEKKMYVIYS